MIRLVILNESRRKGLYRGDNLRRLAGRICECEGFDQPAELSLLFCDDPFIAQLNRTYRKRDYPTDVLSFAQQVAAPSVREAILGDIVISLERVEDQCRGERTAMRDEVRLLFCHGLLHLLGWRHETARAGKEMAARQAQCLGIPLESAWRGLTPRKGSCSRAQ